MSSSGTDPLVQTADGPVLGRTDAHGVMAFLGIPYAAAPTGPRRFAPPEAPPRWSAPHDGRSYGPTAPQPTAQGPLAQLLPHVEIPGDGYLNLNVWTADLEGSRPVMVFIHGGSFTSGSGAIPTYSGAAFARDGIVLVTINYRLGVDGFLWFGEGTPNLGLLDQVAALRWVRDQIASFGGDPANVTVFGESAGAMSVCTLLAMPSAAGLFRRAIAQSGAARCVLRPETAALAAARVAEVLGVSASRRAIAEVSRAAVLEAQAALEREVASEVDPARWRELSANLMPFEPVVDGEILPQAPSDAIRAGAADGIGLLVGTNADEANLFFVPSGVVAGAGDADLARVARSRGYPPAVLDAYRAARPTASAGRLVSELMTDGFYVVPALELAADHPHTFVYRFAWASPAFGGAMGACHALELPFVFDTLDDPGYRPLLGSDPPRQLAAAVHRAWIDFAATGDPGWPAYSAQRPEAMEFATPAGVAPVHRPQELAAWGASGS
ncbi:carboxylesterase family protein [Acidiferrimicrobium sp. IK]|uniref:carboxylesterase/lipase family protein n=1 Tax=Acidiferrimicrobium sp. IK TaxID=2871700 RepID=UPI0021CB4408|nr:carboxylesterase family protein [Acidiferrimicrobium sp. IK]MCU4186671.1 carboxylesterase family protein [Acidiferrimicrobium sp. IK]